MVGARRKTKTILFYSPQGGTGKTTCAVNTAILWAMNGVKVLLVDLSTYGSIMSVLRIPQKAGNGLPSIATFLDLDFEAATTEVFMDVVGSSIVKSVLFKNMDVLINCNPVRMDAINEDYMRIIIKALKDLPYDYILVDTTSDLNCRNLILLEDADYVVMPCIQDISCGWKMLLFRDVVEKYSLNRSKIGIVINKYSKYSGFNNQEFETEIGYTVIGEIPLFIKNYQNYINQGILIHLKKNKNAFVCFNDVTKTIFSIVNR